jgi:hypothetical protein
MIPFHVFIEKQFGLTLTEGLIITGSIVWAFALLSAFALPETYGKSMDFTES